MHNLFATRLRMSKSTIGCNVQTPLLSQFGETFCFGVAAATLAAHCVQDDLAQLKRRRQQEREVESCDAKRLAASQEGKKVGDAGYRYHARVPRAAQPAYVNAPQVSEAVRSLHAHMWSCTVQVDGQSPRGGSSRHCLCSHVLGS